MPQKFGLLAVLLLISLLACLLTAASAAYGGDDSDAEENKQELQDEVVKRAKSRTVVIDTLAKYRQYIQGRDNEYSVVLLATLSEKINTDGSQCPYCPMFEAMFNTASIMTFDQQQSAQTPIFFAVYAFAPENRDLAATLGLRTAPSVMYFEAGKTEQPAKWLAPERQDLLSFLGETVGIDIERTKFQQTFVKRYPQFAEMMNPSKSNEQQQDQAGTQSENLIVRLITNYGTGLLSIVLFIAILYFTCKQAFGDDGYKPIFYTALSWFGIVLSVGGTVFNAINEPPPFYYNPNAKSISEGLMVFMPQLNRQFGLEGYIASVAMLSFAAMLLLGTHALTQISKAWHSIVWMISFGLALFVLFFLNMILLMKKMPGLYQGSPAASIYATLFSLLGRPV